MNRCNPRYGKVPMSFRFSSILHKISDCVHFVSSIKGCEQDSSLGEGSCLSSLSVHRNTSCVLSLDPHDRLMPPASLCLQTLYIVLANTLNSILTQLSIKYFQSSCSMTSIIIPVSVKETRCYTADTVKVIPLQFSFATFLVYQAHIIATFPPAIIIFIRDAGI